ncbi:hypothetical protein [Salinisphaera aquimarina]|uniref:Uncharacterized protein n=1 Tax=Salinisphaera aquimarina TaxID=2094031 RepID=A0ABV7EQQ3_9GAMM
MIMGFPNKHTSENWLQTITQYVSAPYCEAANSSNRQAFLAITLKNENVGRVYACEKQEWSGWFSLTDEQTTNRISTVAEAKAACKRIQSAQSLPIACKFNYLNDTPGIFLRLRNKSEYGRYKRTLMKSLVEPFCSAENKKRQFAIVAFKLDEYNLVKFYSCPDSKSTEWKNYSGQGV